MMKTLIPFTNSESEFQTLVAMTSVHPITVVRELIQFGYEPFPTTCGRKYIFFGEEMAFLPNIFSYSKKSLIPLSYYLCFSETTLQGKKVFNSI